MQPDLKRIGYCRNAHHCHIQVGILEYKKYHNLRKNVEHIQNVTATRIETQINKKGESPNRKKEIKVQIEKGK